MWRRSWPRWYLRHCRRVLRAAWLYLKNGDEWSFDQRVRLAMQDRRHPSPFVRLARSTTYIQGMIGVTLIPTMRAATKALAEFQQALDIAQRRD